ncbi:MAG: hypothetical protein V7K40_22520 [Nostoc sp.]|uniref:hypothetical protein n=1 Tax=Nostoc sp. TaxID=1180 RepID=UPI002FF7A2CE
MGVLTIAPSTVTLVRISVQPKACTNGLGRANPEVLIEIQSRRSPQTGFSK